MAYDSTGLNPSYTGIWSRGMRNLVFLIRTLSCLNPSYTGIWSRGEIIKNISNTASSPVLTLLILEFGLGAMVGIVVAVKYCMGS